MIMFYLNLNLRAAKLKQQVELLDASQFLGFCELVYALDDQIYI